MPKLEVRDVTRLNLEPGEVLLVRLPRSSSLDNCRAARDILRHALNDKVPVVVTRDDVEFLAIDGRKLIAAGD